MNSTFSRKSDRKLIFTQEILDEARRRTENGESQRKVAASLGMKESTLRNRLKLMSSIN
jgi:transcription initiation factor TFIIIB Brf1 subunit/transcription initiation factor TFIIB